MSDIEGSVLAVPTANREAFITHAKSADSAFLECGATRVLECWGEDVRDGKLTDFRRAVQATPEETVVFSWIEWPDKATRNTAVERMQSIMGSDPRFDPEMNPMPFDGKRMIYGGFQPVVELTS